MLKNKLIKKLAFAVTVCSLANVFSFGMTAMADAPAYDGVICAYDFNDAALPEGFDSTMFEVQNGALKALNTGSGFTLSNLPKDVSVEFKVKPLENSAIPSINVEIGNAAISYEDANFRGNAQGKSWDDVIRMKSKVTGASVANVWADGKQSRPKGSFFPDTENGHTLKYVSRDNVHSLYIDGVLTLTGECKGKLSAYNFSFNVGSLSDHGVYLDDIVVKDGSVPYSYNFDDNKLPAEFDSTKFSAENGMLKANGAGSKVTFAAVPKNCVVEFKLKPISTEALAEFSLGFGNISFSYDNYGSVNSGSDSIVVYERVDSWSQLQKVWANGQGGRPSGSFFPANTDGHTLRAVSYGNTYSVYIDDTQMFTGTENAGEMSAYNVIFEASGAMYLDDVVVRESEAPYSYNFNDGKLPAKFDATMFTAENGMLKANGANSVVKFADLSENYSIEFKIKPLDGAVIPRFYVDFGNAEASYVEEHSTAPSSDNRLLMYNRNTWGTIGSWWANGSGAPKGDLFPDTNGYKLKFVVKDNMHSVYVNDVPRINQECTDEPKEGNNHITFGISSKAATGMYIDDIEIKLLDFVPEFKVAVSVDAQNTKTCNVTMKNIDTSNEVIFAAYKGDVLVGAEIRACANESETFTSTSDIDKIKVMIWDGIDTMEPMYDAITVLSGEWTVTE